MSRKANPFTIGLFVVGAIVIFVAGLVVLGSGQFFKTLPRAILFFQGSVNGLNVGAPVALRGVQIGQVKEIKLYAQKDQVSFVVPVIIELDPSKINYVGKRELTGRPYIQQLIDSGLRGQLQTQSMVTGLLFVNFDFYPNAPLTLHGQVLDEGLPEIPTIPSAIEELSKSLSSIPLTQIANQLQDVLLNVNLLLKDGKITEAIANFNTAAQEGVETVRVANEILEKFNGQAAPIAENVRETTEAAAIAAEKAATSLKEINGMLAPDSEFRFELIEALRNFNATMRSMRALTDSLERDPNAVIFGKNSARKPDQ